MNFIVVSDHGMAAANKTGYIPIHKYTNMTMIDESRCVYGPISHIRTKSNFVITVIRARLIWLF